MNEFVDECRREWKRLGVPDPVAAEMAADLAADLEEAMAEGASPEDVLGNAASDARSFAAAWATERGLIRHQRASARAWRARVPLATAAVFAIVAIVGAALVIRASPSGAGQQGLTRFGAPSRARVVVKAPTVWVTRVEPADSGGDTHTVGSVLLIVGLAGIVPLALYALWARPGGRRELLA